MSSEISAGTPPVAAGGHVCIVGAGHAGGAVAALLRQYDHTGSITLIGDEPYPPYQRPPLSKAFLKGEAEAETLALRPLEFYAENDIAFLPDASAVEIRRDERQLLLSDGARLNYDFLILATGARPIALEVPGSALGGIHFLRSASDAEALRAELGSGKRLAVVGGGYIGLEVAAAGRGLGADVVVLEREPRLLMRVACEPLSGFFKLYHERQGVRFELGCTIAGFLGDSGRVTGVALADGRVIACDVAVVGVGARPNQELAAEAGLETDRGVVVDLEARTCDPRVFAIGDVTHRPLPIYGRTLRLESVPNALEQAKQAAAAIVGRPAPAPEVPWQWSEQYDLKLQIAGQPFDADGIVIRGDPESAHFAVFHLSGDRIQSVEAVNAPAEFMIGRQLIGNRRPIDRARLADPSVSLRDVTV